MDVAGCDRGFSITHTDYLLCEKFDIQRYLSLTEMSVFEAIVWWKDQA
jgi:hypothetical protein